MAEDKRKELSQYSDLEQVQKNANNYFGYDKPIYVSTKKNKKFMIQKNDGKWVHFGAFKMEDYTKHKDEDRRKRYLARALNIKGKWRDDKYSANNLAIHLLWG